MDAPGNEDTLVERTQTSGAAPTSEDVELPRGALVGRYVVIDASVRVAWGWSMPRTTPTWRAEEHLGMRGFVGADDERAAVALARRWARPGDTIVVFAHTAREPLW